MTFGLNKILQERYGHFVVGSVLKQRNGPSLNMYKESVSFCLAKLQADDISNNVNVLMVS